MLAFITTKPGDKYRSIKFPAMYEALRRRGMSKSQAAAISNAAARKRGKSLPIVLKAPNYGARAGQTIGGRLVRGNDGKFASGGGAAPVKPKRTPKRTPEQRAAEREQARRDTRDAVLAELGIDPGASEALVMLQNGEQPQPEALARMGATEAGLVEQARDGSYRLTPAGRQMLNAAERGDKGMAGDVISRSRDRLAAQAEKPVKPAGGGGGGGKKKPEKPPKLPARQGSQAPRTVGGSGAKPPAEKPERAPATDPALAALAQRLSAGETLTDDEQQTLIRNGLARVVRGELVLTMAGQRIMRTKQDDSERAMFAKMGGSGGGGGGGGGWKKGPGGKRVPPFGVTMDRARSRLQSPNYRNDNDLRSAMSQASGARDKLHQINSHLSSGEMGGRKIDAATRRNLETQRRQYEKREASALRDVHRLSKPVEKTFHVYKDARGRLRWVAYSSNAYRDRDEEIVSTKALTDDCARADQAGSYGPLRWWHVPGWELGECDFNAMHGRVLVESGTFKSDAIGRAVAAKAADLQLSIGFTHAPDEPDRSGVFHHIQRFERSLVPSGRAANPFTRLIVKETRMDTEKETALKTVLGDEAAQHVLAGAEAVQKDADDRQTAYKASGDPWYAVAMAIKAAVAPAQAFAQAIPALAPPPAAEPVAEKAIEDIPEAEAKAEVEVVADEAMIEEPAAEDPGEMTYDEFVQAIRAVVREEMAAELKTQIAPLAGMLDIEKKVGSAVQSLMAPYQAQKDDEAAQLREQLKQAQDRLAELEGDIPAAFRPYSGFRASEAPETVLKQAGALPPTSDDSNDPFAEIRDKLFGTTNGRAQ